MTEQMAIEYLLNRYLVVGSPVNPPKEECEKQNAVIDMAIQALEKQSMVNEILNELKQYRAIGTVEEIQMAMKYASLAKKHGTVGKAIDECAKYEAIGTVEEFKALKENQRKCEDCAGCTNWNCDCYNERVMAIEEFAEAIKTSQDAHTWCCNDLTLEFCVGDDCKECLEKFKARIDEIAYSMKGEM